MMKIFDKTKCELGEGPLWHPIRQELFWFDILSAKMFHKKTPEQQPIVHEFNRMVSAAGWVNKNVLLIASETNLFLYDLNTRVERHLIDLEKDNLKTRSNDGRSDPWGGFWIGTMGKNCEPDAGAIYRYFEGKLKLIISKVTISNSICFSIDKKYCYFSDTAKKNIMRIKLDSDNGSPIKNSEIFIDLADEVIAPDGSVVDGSGNIWNAQWGSSRVARYDLYGNFREQVSVQASQTSCPAFGGANLSTLFVTSANEGVEEKFSGCTFYCDTQFTGQQENRVIITQQ